VTSELSSRLWILPIAEFFPTAITTIVPSPERILLPERRIGEDT